MRKLNKLTLEELESLNTASTYNSEQHKDICGRAALELIEYKKIEERLGIDLITFGKLVLYGCYVVDYWEDDDWETSTITHFEFCELISAGFFASYSFSCEKHYFTWRDYGRSWALTKEELEHD